MAVRHVKVGGTLSSGNSTADDWTLANCYPTITTAISAAGKAGGDELILEDETHNVSGMITCGTGPAGSYLIRARTARVDNDTAPMAVISGSSGTGALFLFNNTVDRTDLEFRDVLFTKSVTHTDQTRPVMCNLGQKTGDFKLTRIWFKDIAINIASGAWSLGLIAYQAAPTLFPTVTMADLRYENISGIFGGAGVASTLLGDHLTPTTAVTVLRNIVARNLSIDTQGASACFRINGRLSAKDIDLDGFTHASTGATSSGHFLTKESTGFGHISRVRFANVSSDAVASSSMIRCHSPHSIRDILGINVQLVSSNSAEGIGSLVSVFSDARGITRNVRAYRCRSNNGTAVYYSNGSMGIVDNVWAEQCEVGEGLFYKGGDGDVAWSNLVAINNTQLSIGQSTPGLVFYGHVGGSTYRRNCLIGLRDLISKGNTTIATGIPIKFSDDGATYKLDVIAKRITCRDKTGVRSIITGLHEININIADSNLAGTIQNNGTGVITQTDITDSDIVVIGGLSDATQLDDRWPVAYRAAMA